MNYKEFINALRAAGSNMTHEQINQIGIEAQEKFGINKDDLMFILISGTEEFRNWVFKRASKI